MFLLIFASLGILVLEDEVDLGTVRATSSSV